MSKTDWDKVAHQTERPTPLAYTIKDTVKMIGISRSRLYEELKAGHLVAKKVGRTTLIPHESIQNWLKTLADYPTPTGASSSTKFIP